MVTANVMAAGVGVVSAVTTMKVVASGGTGISGKDEQSCCESGNCEGTIHKGQS